MIIMQAQAYEGYFENGRFYFAGKIMRIPEHQRVYITVLDEPVFGNKNAEAWQEFLSEVKQIYDEPLPELERVRFREVPM